MTPEEIDELLLAGVTPLVTEIDERDLRIDVYRSGIGTNPHVRITHLPTSLVVGCGTEATVLQAKAVCMAELRGKLAAQRLGGREPGNILDDLRALAASRPRYEPQRYVISPAAHARAVELIGPQPADESAESWLVRAAEAERNQPRT